MAENPGAIDNISIEIGASSAKAIKEVKKVADAIKDLTSKGGLGSVGNAIKNSMKNVASEYQKTGSVLGRIRDSSKGAAAGIKKTGDSAKKSVGPLGKFANALGRIAMYRVLRTIIKEITQAFQEGLQNVYAFSQTIGSSISQALDSISGASLRMKNQLGAALGELLVTIRPVLEAIIGLITRVADALSQFFALLGGRTVYHKATDSVKQWGAAATGAAKAAKEWKNQLMGFDEINRLEEPSDTGGGGGGGDSGIGNWELSPVTLDLSWLDKYREATKEWISNLDWEPLTKALDTLEQRLKEFAKIVDSVVYWAYTNVLLPLGKWVIEDAAPASVELLASMFNILNAVLEKVAPIFQWLWEEILRPFGAWIGKEFVFIISRLSEIFNELADVIKGKLKFKDFWNELSGAEKILLAVAAAVAGLNIAMFALSHPIMTIISVLVLLGSALGVTTEDILKCFDWIKNAIGTLLHTFDFFVEGIKTIFGGIKSYFSGLVDFIAGAITGNWERAWDGIVQIFYGVYQTFVGIIQSMFGWISSLIDAVSTGISWIRGLFDHIGALGQVKMAGPAGGAYASGGFVEEGPFYMNQGEIVGQFSNGKTAVANNAMIVEGISEGVFNAVVSALSQTGGNGGSNQPVNIYLDGKIIANSTTKYQNQYARVRGV